MEKWTYAAMLALPLMAAYALAAGADGIPAQLRINQPDLTVSGLMAVQATGTCLHSGEHNVLFQMNVSNVGNATAANFTDRLRVFGPTNLTADFAVDSLPAGSVAVHSKNGCFKAGNYTVIGDADWFNQVSESNEGNNERITYLQVV